MQHAMDSGNPATSMMTLLYIGVICNGNDLNCVRKLNPATQGRGHRCHNFIIGVRLPGRPSREFLRFSCGPPRKLSFKRPF